MAAMTKERADTLERLIAEHNQSTAWTDELLSAARESIRYREALERLVERVDLNGGLGEYKGGHPWALRDARAALEAK